MAEKIAPHRHRCAPSVLLSGGAQEIEVGPLKYSAKNEFQKVFITIYLLYYRDIKGEQKIFRDVKGCNWIQNGIKSLASL